MSRDSSDAIATGYGLDGRGIGVRVPVGLRFVISSRYPDRYWDPTQPPIQWVLGAPSWGLNRTVRKANYSPPTSAVVNNT
jgi:hypothetical protein